MAQQSRYTSPGAGGARASQDQLSSEVIRMASVFWASRQRRKLLTLAVALILVVGATAFAQIKLNAWNRPFYNALTRKDMSAFVEQLHRLRRVGRRSAGPQRGRKTWLNSKRPLGDFAPSAW